MQRSGTGINKTPPLEKPATMTEISSTLKTTLQLTRQEDTEETDLCLSVSCTVVKINQEVKKETQSFTSAAWCELTVHLLKRKNSARETEGWKAQPM